MLQRRYLTVVVVALFCVAGCTRGGKTFSLDDFDSAGDSDRINGDQSQGTDLFEDDSRAPDGTDDLLEPPQCIDGATTCINEKKAVCDPVFGWLLEACPEGLICFEGECVESACNPLDARCEEDGVQICSPDGTGWSDVMPCPDGQVCHEGTCVPPKCEPGTAICSSNKVLTCSEDGMSWEAIPCEEEQVCFDGQCIECISDDDCDEGLSCETGMCVEPPLEIITLSLPDGKEGEEYSFTLEGEGGIPPYFWQVVDGDLPAGVELSEDGLLTGNPGLAGPYVVTIELSDDLGDAQEAEYEFTIFAPAGELIITTGSPLPSGEEGFPYEVQLAATGGAEPFIWGISSGALPAGLIMASSGLISGTPADHGTFDFTVKVFDNSEPVGFGSKEFQLTMKIAPLEIIGGQQFDLLITSIVVLPLITTLESIPIPYSNQLEAKGGVKPYTWTEQPMPQFVQFLIPNGGLPAGLILEEDGNLHGSTTDTEKVVNVTIPFTGIDLSGYFFMAEVADVQDPPDSDWAIYLIPTVPVAW
jgi:hypothetical protein